jgi:hypothetical protein
MCVSCPFPRQDPCLWSVTPKKVYATMQSDLWYIYNTLNTTTTAWTYGIRPLVHIQYTKTQPPQHGQMESDLWYIYNILNTTTTAWTYGIRPLVQIQYTKHNHHSIVVCSTIVFPWEITLGCITINSIYMDMGNTNIHACITETVVKEYDMNIP